MNEERSGDCDVAIATTSLGSCRYTSLLGLPTSVLMCFLVDRLQGNAVCKDLQIHLQWLFILGMKPVSQEAPGADFVLSNFSKGNNWCPLPLAFLSVYAGAPSKHHPVQENKSCCPKSASGGTFQWQKARPIVISASSCKQLFGHEICPDNEEILLVHLFLFNEMFMDQLPQPVR